MRYRRKQPGAATATGRPVIPATAKEVWCEGNHTAVGRSWPNQNNGPRSLTCRESDCVDLTAVAVLVLDDWGKRAA